MPPLPHAGLGDPTRGSGYLPRSPHGLRPLLENVMDVSHVPFTHHNSVGKAGAPPRDVGDGG